MTTYWIEKYTASGKSERVYETNSFDQEAIQAKFDEAAVLLKDGEELEYGKTTPEAVHPCMLVVERTGGKLERWGARGNVPYTPKSQRQ